MKKWLSGLLCGVALMVLPAAGPSNSIYGVLFPSQVTFHYGNEVKTVEGTGENGVLNYNNKAYIQLRSFAEAMGASVEYEPPADQTGLHKIDIQQGKAPVEWKLVREGVDPFCGKSQSIHIGVDREWIDGKMSYRNYIISITNDLGEDISTKPIDLTFRIRAVGSNEVIYSRTIPSFSGVIPNAFTYKAQITWDLTGNDGKEVPPGKYYVDAGRPSSVEYISLDSGAEKTTAIEKGLGGCNLGYFQVTIE